MDYYFLYIIYSPLIDKYYIGSSKNPHIRLIEHNDGKNRWSRKTRDWKLVYTERFSNKISALARERQLKNWKNRDKIVKLIGEWSSGSSPGS